MARLHLTTLAILDPTSLFGQEVSAALADAFPERRRRFFHTRPVDEHLIAEITGQADLVPPLTDLDELETCGTVVVTAPPPAEMAEKLSGWLAVHGEVALIDCTQPGIVGDALVTAGGLPRQIPRPVRLQLVDPCLAGPERVLSALAPLGVRAATVTACCPASGFGEEALDELAAQAAARLSGLPVRPPEVLPAITALDVSPADDARQARLAAQLQSLAPGVELSVTVLDVGVFHGHVATLTVTLDGTVREAEVRKLLRSFPALRLARKNEKVSATAVVGEETVTCAGIRICGQRVEAVVATDGLRAMGAGIVVGLVAQLTAV